MSSPKPLPQGLPSLWRILKYFWPHARQYRALIAGSLAALFAEVALRLLEPWPIKLVFDHILGSKRSRQAALPEIFKSLDTTAITKLRHLSELDGGIVFLTHLPGQRIEQQVVKEAKRQLLNWITTTVGEP